MRILHHVSHSVHGWAGVVLRSVIDGNGWLDLGTCGPTACMGIPPGRVVMSDV